jgi:hypothetical protein
MIQAHIKDDFNNLLDYHKWVNVSIGNISKKNRDLLAMFHKSTIDQYIRQNPNWFGEGTSYSELVKGITQYKDPQLIENIFNQINDKVSTQTKDKIKARKVRFNPNGLGVFVFDRASMGMYRLKEFYSPSLNQVVDEKLVISTKNGYKLLSDSSHIEERYEQKENGDPKIRTTSKNVYAYFPKKNKEKQAVELFISCGGHVGIKADQLLYSGISAIVVAQLLEMARIQTKISIVFGSSPDGFEQSVYACLVPVKNYDETLDVNLLALLTSDPRFFRYEGFKGIIASYDYFNAKCPDSLGKGMTKNYLSQVIEKSDYSKQKALAPNRFYFGWTFSEQAAIEQINETIEEISKRIIGNE